MSTKSSTEPKKETTTTEPTSTSQGTQESNPKNTEPTNQTTPSDSDKGIIEEGTSTEEVTEPKVEEPTKETEVAPEPGKPEPYELILAEESPLSDAEFDEIVQEAERLNLSKEDAEKLIQMREYSHKAAQEVFDGAHKAKVESMRNAYVEESSKFTKEDKLSLREAINTFGSTPEFKEMFRDPAMNFNIPLAKFLISVGDKIRGGQNTIPTGKSSSVESDKLDPVTRTANNFYKNM